MSPSAWMISLVTVIYVFTAASLFVERKPGLALAFFGYALANLGLIWAGEAH